MAKIQLFVCCHQPVSLPEHELLIPVQVGAALADTHFPGFLHDDSGENISEKNHSYCELTAQYWAWKNADSDHMGFFHYRRFLYPDTGEKVPYRILPQPDGQLPDKLGYDRFAALIPQYDLILPKAENMRISVREHYTGAPFHHAKDLALIETIIAERCPEYLSAVESYLSGTLCYFGNIYIMKRDVFSDYCAWLFPILEEFDRRTDRTGYGTQEQRVNGYLAERLFGIYYTHHRADLHALELPRVHFCPPEQARRKQLLNALLPPGSWRRSAVKALKGRVG